MFLSFFIQHSLGEGRGSACFNYHSVSRAKHSVWSMVTFQWLPHKCMNDWINQSTEGAIKTTKWLGCSIKKNMKCLWIRGGRQPALPWGVEGLQRCDLSVGSYKMRQGRGEKPFWADGPQHLKAQWWKRSPGSQGAAGSSRCWGGQFSAPEANGESAGLSVPATLGNLDLHRTRGAWKPLTGNQKSTLKAQQGGEGAARKPWQGLGVSEKSQFSIIFNLPGASIPKCTMLVKVKSS